MLESGSTMNGIRRFQEPGASSFTSAYTPIYQPGPSVLNMRNIIFGRVGMSEDKRPGVIKRPAVKTGATDFIAMKTGYFLSDLKLAKR
jgi:hypothetical protein